MRYGLLPMSEWNPEVEGYPDGTVVIVLLNDDNTIGEIPDQFRGIHGIEHGWGAVYPIEGNFMGNVLIPRDIHFSYTFTTVAEARQFVYDAWVVRQEIDRSPEEVADTIARNRYELDTIDMLIEGHRNRRTLLIMTIVLIALLLFFILLMIFAVPYRGHFQWR